MKNFRNVFLIGYMGSGKSTMGRELADLMGWKFVDLDDMIETTAGKSVNALFEDDGEPAFRRIETTVLGEVADSKSQVIATGGGTPISSENLQVMRHNGLVVYLEVSLSELINRLERDRSERPLLRQKSSHELATYVQSHLELRIPKYEQADVLFDAKKGVVELMQVLNDYSK